MKVILPKKALFASFLLLFILSLQAQQFSKIESLINFDNITNNNGVAVADFDLDNDLDIFIVGAQTFDRNDPNTWSRLLKNNNDGSFTDVTVSSGFDQGFNHQSTFEIFNSEGVQITSNYIHGDKLSASWADYNNDGYPDIFLANGVQSQLYKNNGDGTFTNVTVMAGFEETCLDCYMTGALWWDYNKDGYLDIFLSNQNYVSKNKLYKNNGDGTFTLITDTVFDTNANSFSAVALDFNDDGYPDLYVTNDFDQNNFLYINQAGTGFVESAVLYGVEDPFDGMGLAVNDFDNNGIFDFLVTNIKENGFFIKNNSNTYDNKATILGISDTDWAWGAVFADFDLDGFEDFYVVNGFTGNKLNQYYKNTFSGIFRTFTQTPLATGLEAALGRSTVAFDYDNDGDLDLVATNYNSNIFFFENKENSGRAWAKFKLVGTTSNKDALGSIIEVNTDIGSQQFRLHQGALYQSQSIQPEHFGLEGATIMTSVSVTWPTGVKETYTNLPIDKTFVVTEGSGYVIIGNNTAVKVLGCTDPNACNYNASASLDNGSCSYLASGNITGNANSRPLLTANYQYTNAVGNQFIWSVENGKILAGQGTNTITIKWNVANVGTVSCINSDSNCQTETVSFQVILDNTLNNSTHSIARDWNDELLNAIRVDFARPTVHARNLFHSSILMYDAWALFDSQAETVFLGKTFGGYTSTYNGITAPTDVASARHQIISYAMYRLLSHRFATSPGATISLQAFDALFASFGYDKNFTSTDYSGGSYAALGNYLASEMIAFGLQDGSNEQNSYDNRYYTSVNNPLILDIYTDTNPINPDRWQPLAFDVFIDQSGNPFPLNTPDFLGPEWGEVTPFSLKASDLEIKNNGFNSYVYNDPGPPNYIQNSNEDGIDDPYKWHFTLVASWSSHLDPSDPTTIDISPGAIGNVPLQNYPSTFAEYKNFYDFTNGGDPGTGHALNPTTNLPYPSQIVKRADYARVLAEFWADGPDSETPPGHWFTLLNYVSDHAATLKKFNGQGVVLSDLEWDVKTYLVMGGAMHDSAIDTWGIKGYYDYVRPISALRYMAGKGQSSDMTKASYDPHGLPLIPGLIELIKTGDPLSGTADVNVGKIKIYAWKGPDFISNPDTDIAGVDWILGTHWWPYQRGTFVTPPFAGYLSGHSTFSRAAAEVMTLITGDAFFPGGVGTFDIVQNQFLVFEEGPSENFTLQWATYRDASDQTSLSRIWGGIHPPIDDIRGRIIGDKIGNDAYNLAQEYFTGTLAVEDFKSAFKTRLYPIPFKNELTLKTGYRGTLTFELFSYDGKRVVSKNTSVNSNELLITMPNLASGIYFAKLLTENNEILLIKKVIKN